jgi:hypothetical protein
MGSMAARDRKSTNVAGDGTASGYTSHQKVPKCLFWMHANRRLRQLIALPNPTIPTQPIDISAGCSRIFPERYYPVNALSG